MKTKRHLQEVAFYENEKSFDSEPVANGAYFYTLKAGDFTATRKMPTRKQSLSQTVNGKRITTSVTIGSTHSKQQWDYF
ncbi:MAG: hypothetical protein OXU27_17470 [Candidatus Poribacteria bacterium]|nr:hypothetical protein [Candidatus Poribacteria bacterium]MDE0327448.1 hypothetical protein [Candidatus Poribacteria bacterium]